MSLLKQLLMDKKIFEAEEAVDKFLADQGIEEGYIPQRLEFDRDVFTQKEQVDEFLQAHLWASLKIEEKEDMYVATMFDEIAFMKDSMKLILIRDGVLIAVGILRPMTSDNPLMFKLPEDSVKLSADLPYIIELATVVDGFHAAYGEVKITKQHLKSFKDNFDNKVYGVDLSLDFDHETREAAGWVKEVFLSDDERTLLGLVTWTPSGARALSDREFRYFSPEFSLNWIHPHTGVNHGPTLIGGALVNRPFLKMDAIVGLKDKQKNEVKNMETISLTEHNNKVQELQNEVATLQLSAEKVKTILDSNKAEIKALTEERDALVTEKEQAEKDARFNKLFSENKINKAQLDALKEGKDMFDVLSLSEQMNTNPKGNDKTPEKVQLSEEEMAVCKAYDIDPEDYVKANGGQ